MAGLAQNIVGLLAESDDCATLDELDNAIDRPRKRITACIPKLVTRGTVERKRAGCYRLTKPGRADFEAGKMITCGPRAPLTAERRPRKRMLRRRLWSALRKAGGYATIPDLLVVASAGDEKAAANNALVYLRLLEAGGFVVRSRRREAGTSPNSNGYIRWLLLPGMDTGPEHPRKFKGRLLDPNTQEHHELGAAK